MLNLLLDYQLKHLITWLLSALAWLRSAVTELPHYLNSSRVKHNHVDKQMHQTSYLKPLIVIVVLYPLLAFCLYVPVICAGLSYWRLRQPDYASGNTDASHANLKPGMDLFYYICIAQGLMFMFIMLPFETLGTEVMVFIVGRQVGLSHEVVLKYFFATKIKYFDNLASSDESWNLITYGAGLLDSEMPEDNATGARVLTTLIERGMPVRRQLLRSPTHRIQKLIGALAWRSACEAEMRWLASRIVEHVAPGLNLYQFPGALECISSLLDTSGYNKKDGNQEAVNFVAQLRLDRQQDKQKGNYSEIIIGKMIKCLMQIHWVFKKGDTEMEDTEKVGIKSVEGTNEDLILQGLRILENLALNEHNGKVICSMDALLSKIVAPVSSESLIQDTKINTTWTKVIDGSLKLVRQLMRSPGDTGKEMCRKVAENSRAVKNLEEVLVLGSGSYNIIGLQIRAIEILEQLSSVESTSSNWARERRENIFMKVLHIFFTDKWMEDYLLMAKVDEEHANQDGKMTKSKKTRKDEQASMDNKTKAAEETAKQMKEKAGEALITLCMAKQIISDDIMSFTGCGGDAVHYLTEMLDSEKRTIRCKYSAAVILKYLCAHCTTLDHDYLKQTTLKKVLTKVLHIKTEAQATDNSKLIHNEQRHMRQHEDRALQVALLSLCTAIPDFASVMPQLVPPKDLAEKLKKIVEESRYATASCLATVKLTCEIVMALIPHVDPEIKMEEIMDSLCKASEKMAGLEGCMLFAGTDHDCYGLLLKPFSSDLVKQARELLRQKEQEIGLPNV